MGRTQVKVSMIMIRPNKKGSIGPRIDRAEKNTMNKGHGRLLQECKSMERKVI